MKGRKATSLFVSSLAGLAAGLILFAIGMMAMSESTLAGDPIPSPSWVHYIAFALVALGPLVGLVALIVFVYAAVLFVTGKDSSAS